MASWLPEQRVRLPISLQRWDSLTFLHWSYDPDVVQRLLPEGLEVHTFDGLAWVGLTPFRMLGLRVPGLPSPPGLSAFPETNLRTYVRGRDGTDGLWFFTLEAHRLPAVVAIRSALALPYRWATMAVDTAGDRILYRSRRRPPHSPRPASRILVEVGAPLEVREVTPLEVFLVGRWRAFSPLLRQMVAVPVEHEPWPLARARAVELRDELITTAGLPAPDAPPLVHFSPGVDVRLGPPRLVR